MSAIGPINNITPSIAPAVSAPSESAKPKTSFGEALDNYIQQADKDQHNSNAAVQDLLAGRTEDVLPVVSAVAKADMSFKLLIGVRNKVIEAYKQTLNMQV